MIHVKTLNNGLRLLVNQMSGLLSVSMGILVNTGASQETDEEDGISHFIEHMTFKGTKKRTAFEISDEMDRIGAQVNAFTGKDITCYYCKSTTAHAAEAFEILSDIFLNSTFPEDEMVREKGVIIEEINMNEDTPDDLCLDKLALAYFGEKGYGRNILGPRENVEQFTKADVLKYKQKHYCPRNMVVSMAGNIDVKQAEEMVEKYFGRLKNVPFGHKQVKIELKANSAIKQKDIEQVHIGIAFPSVKRYDERFNATQILNIILGGGMSSRLFQTVREKLGLAYSVYSFLSCYEETGTLTVYAGVNPEKYEQSVEAINKCIAELKTKNISEDEFIRGREQVVSSQIYAQENTGSQMLILGKEMIYHNKIYDFEKRTNEINAVTLSDVLDVIDINFDEKYRATSVVGAADKPV